MDPKLNPKSVEVLHALAQLDDEAFSWVVRACLPSAMLHGAGTQIWPDGTGGFRDRTGINNVREAAVRYLAKDKG